MSDNEYISQENKTMFKRIGLGFLVLVLVGVSFGAGLYFSKNNEVIASLAKEEVVYIGKVLGKYSEDKEGELSQDVNFDLFWDVWDTLKSEYVDKGAISEKEMFYGSIKGMVDSLGDPYTVFMDPKITKEFNEDLDGTFEGIGAEIGIRDDVLTIIAPLDDMPAQKAGLMAGDKVLAIDGETTLDITIDEAVRKIRGENGTDVVLTIYRDDGDGSKDVTITRGVIYVKSLKTELRDDNIFVIKISNFNGDTSSLFNVAVNEVLEKNPSGVILDLRNNPGGYLQTSIEMASEWVEDGVVVIEKFSDESQTEYDSQGRARLKTYPTVVLVNEGSASASEIVAGALRDHQKATIVGEKTFGKGSVQTLKAFGDGSSVKITIAKWLTPNGDCINKEGIEPDEKVELKIEDYKNGVDTQLNKAIEILGGVVKDIATSSDEIIK